MYLALFDEANTFFGALGRYTKGDVAYDKAMYNTLWTTPSLYTRTTSTHKLRLKNPRFNMAFATHADATIKLLTGNNLNIEHFIRKNVNIVFSKKFKRNVSWTTDLVIGS